MGIPAQPTTGSSQRDIAQSAKVGLSTKASNTSLASAGSSRPATASSRQPAIDKAARRREQVSDSHVGQHSKNLILLPPPFLQEQRERERKLREKREQDARKAKAEEERRLEQERREAEQKRRDDAKRAAARQAEEARRQRQQMEEAKKRQADARKELQRKDAARPPSRQLGKDLATALQRDRPVAPPHGRGDLGGARPLSRLEAQQTGLRPAVQVNPVKPPVKRLLQSDDDDEAGPSRAGGGPNYQGAADGKRRRTIEEPADDPHPSVRAPPIRQSNVRKVGCLFRHLLCIFR